MFKLSLLDLQTNGDEESWEIQYSDRYILLTTTRRPNGQRIITSQTVHGRRTHNVRPDELALICNELVDGGFDKLKADGKFEIGDLSPDEGKKLLREVLSEGRPDPGCSTCKGSGKRVLFRDEVDCDCTLSRTEGD